MKNKFRVWSLDFGGTVSIMTDWTTKDVCEKFILDRCKDWPPFAIISSVKTTDKFKNRFYNYIK